jgi:hypothetical protein
VRGLKILFSVCLVEGLFWQLCALIVAVRSRFRRAQKLPVVKKIGFVGDRKAAVADRLSFSCP